MKLKWHLLIIVIMVFLLYPTAKAYIFSGQPSGGDLPNALTYIEYYGKHLTLPPASWQPFWFEGLATVRGYPWLHFYLMQPLVHLLDSYWAVEIYLIITIFLFLLFSYFLFYYLCRNHILSLFLTLLIFYTKGSLSAAFWNGFVTAAADQFFSPLSLLLIFIYLEKKDRRFFLAGAVTAGLAILGHPLIGIFFVLLPSLTALFLESRGAFALAERIKTVFVFLFLTVSISGIIIYPMITLFLATPQTRTCQNCVWDIKVVLSWFNPLIFVSFVVISFLGIIAIYLRRDREKLTPLLILLAILAEFLVLFFSVTTGLNFIPLIGGALWPERMVWAISIVVACISALMGRYFLELFEKGKYFSIGVNFIILIFSVILVLSQPREMFTPLKTHPGIFPSDAALTLGKYKKIEPRTLVPSWLDVNDFNHRFDDLVYEINHWWNMVFAIPNTRGYAQFTGGRFEDWNAWLWAAETDNLKMEKEVSKNQALFLIDWYAVSYFEGNEKLAYQKRGYYADYLTGTDVIEKTEEVYPFTYFKLRPEIVSSIITATNTPSVLIVGNNVAYDTISRVFGLTNTNSRKIIPIQGPDKLEKLSNMNLGDFDALILYNYSYEDFSKAWKTLENYLTNGGRIFIETGSEVKESQSETLPQIFPISQNQRASLGSEWNLGFASSSSIVSGIDPKKFAPPLYQNDLWKFSYVPQNSLVKNNAEILITQAGKPVLVRGSFGRGEIIWSGLNLPYHSKSYNNLQEAKLLENILLYLTGEAKGIPPQTVTRPKPEKITIAGKDFRGVLFKETYDDGWVANADGRTIKIYRAGPDFMYVRIPKDIRGDLKVEFTYRGSFAAWFLFIISIIVLCFSLWYIITGRKLGSKDILAGKIQGNLTHWWEKE